MKAFVEPQFEVKLVYEFQTKANSFEDICWVSVSSYLILWVSNKRGFFWRRLLSLNLNLYKFTSFKQKRILMKIFAGSQLEVLSVYEFQTKAISDEDICFIGVWSSLTLRVSNKIEFLWRHFLSLSLKLCKFMSFKQNRIFMNTFVESQFEVI